MDQQRPDDRSSNLGSTEYRSRLLTKINALIGVLEVAISKVDRSRHDPNADDARLERIRTNLENTLAICNRARRSLLQVVNGEEKERSNADADQARMSYRDYVELASIDEYRRFKELPPIASDDLQSADIDELAKKLSEL
ncbi:MAG: hypothetical protein AAF196_11145 [Planctomycetota bacterium]